MGATPEKFIEVVEAAGADAVGSNCGRGREGFPPLCHECAPSPTAARDKNAGLPQTVDRLRHTRKRPRYGKSD